VPGSQELLVIALVALFVLGPERLPGLARSAARGLARVRNYGVTASKELRGVADLGEIEREVQDLRNELARTRADLRRAMRETIASSSPRPQAGSPADPRAGDLAGGSVSADAAGAVPGELSGTPDALDVTRTEVSEGAREDAQGSGPAGDGPQPPHGA
jgi:sec-independent protein translocase protein TatB